MDSKRSIFSLLRSSVLVKVTREKTFSALAFETGSVRILMAPAASAGKGHTPAASLNASASYQKLVAELVSVITNADRSSRTSASSWLLRMPKTHDGKLKIFRQALGPNTVSGLIVLSLWRADVAFRIRAFSSDANFC